MPTKINRAKLFEKKYFGQNYHNPSTCPCSACVQGRQVYLTPYGIGLNTKVKKYKVKFFKGIL